MLAMPRRRPQRHRSGRSKVMGHSLQADRAPSGRIPIRSRLGLVRRGFNSHTLRDADICGKGAGASGGRMPLTDRGRNDEKY